MWILSDINNPSIQYILYAHKEYVIGRKDCSILIVNDSSISRKHATLQLVENGDICEVTLKDYSKYGTFVNNIKTVACTLQEGDNIKFGTLNSNWKLMKEYIVVTTSCLENADKIIVKQLLKKLNGRLVKEWNNECTLVIMSQLTITVKVICALMSQRAIVLPAYLEHLVESMENQRPCPNLFDYTPILIETIVNPEEVSFEPNIKRKTLFEDKVFIFFNAKQFKRLNKMISLGGGKPILLNEVTAESCLLLDQPNTCLMTCNAEDYTQTQASQNWISEIMKKLEHKGHRSIPDAELGLAVLYSSVAVCCNPAVDPNSISYSHKALQVNSNPKVENIANDEIQLGKDIKTENDNSLKYDVQVNPVKKINRLSTKRLRDVCSVETNLNDSFNSEKRKKIDAFSLDQSLPSDSAHTNFSPSQMLPVVSVKRDASPVPQLVSPESLKLNTSPASKLLPLDSIKINLSPQPQILPVESDNKCFAITVKAEPSTPRSPPQLFDDDSEDNPIHPSQYNLSQVVKTLEIDPSPDEAKPTDYDIGPPSKRSRSTANRLGFISARSTDSVFISNYVKDDDCPLNVTVTEIVSLLKNTKVATTVQKQSRPINPHMVLNNFKKFKKVTPLGKNGGLPRIIGGRDLVEHIAKNNKDLEEFFIPSGSNENNDNLKSTQDLFDYVPLRKRS